MDKPNNPVLPSYLSAIINSLTVRSPKVSFGSNQGQVSSGANSQQNVQLQGGDLMDMFGSFTPLKVKQKILENPILALGKYSSLIKSNIYHI